jgi:hypothetical protein
MTNRLNAAMLTAAGATLVVHLYYWSYLRTGVLAPDFHNAYVSAQLWMHGPRQAYDIGREFAAQGELGRQFHTAVALTPFVQVPAYLLLIWPLGLLPYLAAYALMSIINVGLMVVAVGTLVERRGLGAARRALLWLLGLSTLPLALAMYHAQTMPLVLLMLALGIRWASARPTLAGAALAVATLRYHVVFGALAAIFVAERRVRPSLAVGLVGIVVVSLVTVAGDVGGVLTSVQWAHTHFHPVEYAIPGATSGLPGPVQGLAWAFLAALVIAVGGIAVRRNRDRPGTAALAGGTAWLMVAPYIYPHDLALLPILVVAALAEAWAAGSADGLGYIAVALFCVLEVVTLVRAAGVLPMEAAILVFLAWGPIGRMASRGASAPSPAT